MKEKVMSLAQGKFTYEQPEIILSPDRLSFEVTEGGESTSVFHVKNSRNTKIKGFGAVDNFNIEFLPVFDGKDNEITVKVHAGTRKAGDVMKGEIQIITDCGEKRLPYEINVVGRQLAFGGRIIRDYSEFVEYARENFDEAVALFYHDKFSSIYLSNFEEKRLYQNLTLKNPKKQALEEFLVAHGDKKPLQFMVNKKQLVFETEDEDVCGEFIVAKDSWGMVGIKVTSDHSVLQVNKSFLYAGDFEDEQAVISFRVAADSIPVGIHRYKITLENVYQKLDVVIRIHGMKGAAEREEHLMCKKQIARLVSCHIQYMMNSSLRESWLRMLEKEKEKLIVWHPEYEMQLEGYMGMLSRDEKAMDTFLGAAEGMKRPELGEDSRKINRYLLSQYIKCKINNNSDDKKELVFQIKYYYSNGYRHWRLVVLLERLGYYQGNTDGLLEELDQLWEDGYTSPYMHLYRMMLILQDAGLMKQLDSRTTGALKFGLKHDLITEDIVIAASFLAARKKRSTPALLRLLENCYHMYENEDTLHSICALLIRSERQETKYFKWFSLGVKHSLRITELFEYYMYSMDKEQFDAALASVISYFRYENHLRDSVKVSFYASIVRNREKHPEYFDVYGNVIREFTLKQLYDHRISEELAQLYEAFLVKENVKDKVAKELPYVLFAHRVTCVNKNMERVVVLHDEGGGEMVYNLVNGEAVIHIGTPNYRLYFVDKNGFYHTRTVPYKIEKILNLDLLAENCYENGSEHPVLLLHLFSQALDKDYTSARDAILLHMMVRAEIPGVEYRSKALLALYEYYRSIGEDILLEEVMGQIDFRYIDFEKRPGILQTMIQHKMNDTALQMLKKFEITNCTRKLILLLITWKIEEVEGRFHPYYMQLCDFLYCNGTSNPVTLSYLTNYYMGSTEHLHQIYKDTSKRGASISDGGVERLLGQALFVSDDPSKYADVFLDYYEYGANRILVRAFLGYSAYQYLVGKSELPEEILEKIQKEALSGEHPVMTLAMLKYYSGREELSDTEKEYVAYQLSQYAAMGKILPFMKDFAGKAEVPFEIEHSEIISCFISGKTDVYIEIQDEEGRTTTQPMTKVFEDIYTYETLLFYGENLSYRIFAGNMETPVQQGLLQKADMPEMLNQAFYGIVNEMIDAREKGDQERYAALVKQYKRRHQIAESLFTPL